jgi:hypothetical protein
MAACAAQGNASVERRNPNPQDFSYPALGGLRDLRIAPTNPAPPAHLADEMIMVFRYAWRYLAGPSHPDHINCPIGYPLRPRQAVRNNLVV